MQILAPGYLPLCVTDGVKEYATALLTHCGHWVQPPRRQAKGATPKPRWMPLPHLRYAQVVKQYRRRRLVRVHHRVVFGALAAIAQALAAHGWQIQYRIHREAESYHPPACGCGRPTGDDPL
jgi:hypothetical protein